MTRVALVDYGRGNVHSVAKALRRVGADVELTSDPAVLGAADRLVLPGVGAFADCARAIRDRDLVAPLSAFAASGRPFLGICVGMQLLFTESQEFGHHPGLGLLPGPVVAIRPGRGLKVPHVGWNAIEPPPGQGWAGSFLEGIPAGTMFYFVHSYAAVPADPGHRVADVRYGDERLAAAVRRDNVWGCQFHPEKSGEIGLGLLRKFLSL